MKNIDKYNIKIKEYKLENNNIINYEKYIEINEELNIFMPTNIGIKVNDILNKYFTIFLEYDFTKNVEK